MKLNKGYHSPTGKKNVIIFAKYHYIEIQLTSWHLVRNINSHHFIIINGPTHLPPYPIHSNLDLLPCLHCIPTFLGVSIHPKVTVWGVSYWLFMPKCILYAEDVDCSYANKESILHFYPLYFEYSNFIYWNCVLINKIMSWW